MSSSSSSSSDALQAAIAAVNAGSNVFDVTIVCTTDDHQAAYWMERLGRGLLAKNPAATESAYPLVLAVSEDWNNPGGAGNGLGTLYAVQKAAKLALAEHRVDLLRELADGRISASLYHTAGKGTRLAPLPASENNNKPGVKLPFPLLVPGAEGTCRPLTVLEAVVKQTGLYAAKGRLSVFWGDQVFLPSVPFSVPRTHHVDILCTLIGDTAPSPQEWSERGLEKYGVIAVLDHGEAAQVEKVSHSTATALLQNLGQIRQVGPSLGSFSVSASFLAALLREFETELSEKTGKLDTDPHFWMPLTLSEESYVALMSQKDTPPDESSAHYRRMAAFKARLDMGGMGLFGAVNVGKDACWWDYGQLKLYSQNSLLLLEQGPSADLLRQFLGVSSHQLDSQTGDAAVNEQSYLFGTRVRHGSVVNSLLTAVTADTVQADGAVVVNCVAKKIVAGPGAILYNLVDDSDGGIDAQPGQVLVSVTNEQGGSYVLQSRMDIDGGTAWKTKLDANALSFEEVHASNKDANIREIARKREEHYDRVAAALGF